MRTLDRVNLRITYPGLYGSIMILSLMSVALAVNFWRSNPTFNPFGIPKDLIGGVFAMLGVSQIIFLNAFRHLRKVRYGLTASLSFMLMWGIGNTEQSFAGKASFQLPILYIALAALHVPRIFELLWLERQ